MTVPGMTHLVALSGYASSGKDSAAAALVEDGWQRVAFAGALRALAVDVDPLIDCRPLVGELTETGNYIRPAERLSWLWEHLGYARSKEIPDVRRLLQRLGDRARHHLGTDVWVDVALRCVGPSRPVVLTDCRYPNEAEAVRERGGLVVRVERPGVGPANGHISETALDGYGFDHVIDNSGTLEHLASAIRAVVAYGEPATQGM